MKSTLITFILLFVIFRAHSGEIPQKVIDNANGQRFFTSEMLNKDVTQENIHDTICRKRYSKTIRPPTYYTNKIKLTFLQNAGIPSGDAELYELDHIVPLVLGGHPRVLANLMLQPYQGTLGAKQKDRLELKLLDMVCKHEINLDSAQREIGTDWVSAYGKYVSPNIKHISKAKLNRQ
ncbi:hypothetical protein [Undibacterium sp.]|uniref:hypothetical protein n=1 Tax=Undibacterium sp. TaxID=1914977 RepID=UPI0025E92FAA|nr:hypothetical protein [Undibacterium sp.]